MYSKTNIPYKKFVLAFSLLLAVACSSKKDDNPGPGPGPGPGPNGVEMGAPAKYSKKTIAEEFTGLWCGWCPRMPILLEELAKKQPKLIITAMHYGDVFAIDKTVTKAIMDKLGVEGFPTTVIGRKANADFDYAGNSIKPTYTEAESALTEALKGDAPLGISLATTVTGSSLEVIAKVGSGTVVNDQKRKLVIYVLESGLKGKQENYYAGNATYKGIPLLAKLPDLPKSIDNYELDHVIRKVATDANGDEIPGDYKVKGAIFTKKYTIDISNYAAAKVQIVAFVYGEDDGGKQTAVYNAQVVSAGKTQAFD